MTPIQLTIDFEVNSDDSLSREKQERQRYLDILEKIYAKDDEEPWWNY